MTARRDLIELAARAENSVAIRLLLECTARAISPSSDAPESENGSEEAWSRVGRLALEHGVSSLVYEGVRTSPRLLEACPASVAAGLAALSIVTGLSVEAQIGALDEVTQAFDRKCIDVLTFKGPSLGVLAYESSKLRHSGDIDLLVRQDQFLDAASELIVLGYAPARPDAVLGWEKLALDDIYQHIETKTGVTFVGRKTPIDLHWTLDDFDDPLLRPWFPFSSGFEANRLFDVAVPVSLGQIQVGTLPAEYLLGYLCFHGAKHGWSRLIWVADIAALVRTTSLDWEAVMDRAIRNRNARILRIGLLLASGLLRATLPAKVARFVDQDRIAGSAAGIVARGMFGGLTSWQLHRFRLLAFDGVGAKSTYLAQLFRKRLIPW